jgi:two-component system chemotaxis response regulator CheY
MARILVVDDVESIRNLLQDVLGTKGYECQGAGSAHEALEKVESSDYDLLIIDENMPVMTGSQAIVRLRSDPKHCGLQILMCTGRPPENDMGANGYIPKPIDLAGLFDIVGRTLSLGSA